MTDLSVGPTRPVAPTSRTGGLFVGCLTSQQHACVSQGRICSNNFKCCHTEKEVADQTLYLTQSQYTDTGPIGPSADPKRQAPGRVVTGVPMFKSLVGLDPEKSRRKWDSNPGSSSLEEGALSSRPTRRSRGREDWCWSPGQVIMLMYKKCCSGDYSGRRDVSVLRLGEIASTICGLYLSVAVYLIAKADLSLRDTFRFAATISN